MSGYGSAAVGAGNLAGRAGLLSGGSRNMVGGAGDVLGIYNGLRQGGVAGYGGAALSGADLYGRASGTAIPGLGPVSDIFGIYNGIRQGGVAGYGSAALDAYQLYGTAQAAGLFGGSAAATGGAAAAGATAGGTAASGAVAGTAAAGDAAAAADAAAATSAADGVATAAGSFGWVAAPVALAAYAWSKPAYTLGTDYWNRMNNALTGKGSGNATYDQGVDSTQQRASALQELLGMTQTKADLGAGQSVMGANINQGEWDFLASQGITPQNLEQQYLTANTAAYKDFTSQHVGASSGKQK